MTATTTTTTTTTSWPPSDTRTCPECLAPAGRSPLGAAHSHDDGCSIGRAALARVADKRVELDARLAQIKTERAERGEVATTPRSTVSDDAVLDALRQHPDGATTPTIAAALGVTRQAAFRRLKNLLTAGAIHKHGTSWLAPVNQEVAA